MVSVLTPEPLQRPRILMFLNLLYLHHQDDLSAGTQETLISNEQFAMKFRELRTFYESFLFSQTFLVSDTL